MSAFDDVKLRYHTRLPHKFLPEATLNVVAAVRQGWQSRTMMKNTITTVPLSRRQEGGYAVMSGSDGYIALSLQRDILQFRLSC